ncbi:MAG: ribonuclease H-like domain-containing protein [Acidobacteria bacterium]|jgi:hypothetical protein|nr:ribonuclease H-like domain-containing protein [Acidobacteriota bacterium]
MSKLQSKLNYLKINSDKSKIKEHWENIDSQSGLSTREKLEKLVKNSLKRDEQKSNNNQFAQTAAVQMKYTFEKDVDGFSCRDFTYPLDRTYGKISLSEWINVAPDRLAIIAGEESFRDISPMKLLFFDTETTGLSGGTGTIPFMLGFGYFQDESFRVKIFILNDLDKEVKLLEAVDIFLQEHGFSAVVTYNGKSFDYPLLETRYILQRKRFPLLKLPHLDFLFPARSLWKHTFPSCKLSQLGDSLLGLSRDDDIDPGRIPGIYFNYLRVRSFGLIQGIVEHNALDLLGLNGLLLLAVKYLEDISFTMDEGEILGIARLYDRFGNIDKADELYRVLKQGALRTDILEKSVKCLAVILKKKKLYAEAAELWGELAAPGAHAQNHLALRELSVHLEHREKDYIKALASVHEGLAIMDLSETQRKDFEKRYKRLTRKLELFKKEDEKS